jgi:ABC-type transport system substrate-binding protein
MTAVRPARGATRVRACAWGALAALGLACSNNPYPGRESDEKVIYSAFADAPRRLDVAEAYDVVAHGFTGLLNDKLLDYHYLKRPYELIPSLALEVPKAEPQPDGGVIYRFRMRRGVMFSNDPCFELAGPGVRTREATTRDIAFQLHRLADPLLEVQVRDAFLNIAGFEEFMTNLGERRDSDPDFAKHPLQQQYAEIGEIEGIRTPTPYELEVRLTRPYPQILYWFALEFTSPVAWEAVAYYDGQQGRPLFRDWTVGTGPYRLAVYDKQARVSLVRNENWWGLRAESPETAPAAFYPTEGEPGDAEAGLLDPRYAGKRLPFVDRLESRRDKESIPAFHKFLQGYYDRAGIIRESFDQVVQNDRLSPEMAAKGIRLSTTVGPGWFYLGFNMADPVVGEQGGERSRKLRQAMSLAIDSQEWIDLFLNGRGQPAQSMIPPGLFGFEVSYQNPYRTVDLPRARRLLSEAGYPKGIDPATGRPLRLTFDTYVTNTQQKLQDEYFINEWRKLGLDVQLKATTYNEFQNKVQRLAYQVFFWGWSADYPDPENFLFLRSCDYRRSTVGGPNTVNFCDPRYEKLFREMRVRENDERRMAAIREMRTIIEEERPHIELYHPEDYLLVQGWLHNVKQFGMSQPMSKYYAVDPELRAEQRAAWNRPVRWPAYALGLALALGMIPAFVAFFRERQ